MKTTSYYRENVLMRRPDLRDEWILQVLATPLRTERQPNGRIRHWAYIDERERFLRVVTEPDGETVHNAFFDRRFKP